MADLVLWGAGGHGKVVLDVANATGEFENISFIDDSWRGSLNEFYGCRVLQPDDYLGSHQLHSTSYFVVSIGANQTRAACFQRALDHGLTPVTIVHPSAVISGSVRLGIGTVVMPKAVINAGSLIGENCIVNTAAVIEHDCRIYNHVHLSPGTLLAGGVVVHPFAQVGIGAIVLPGGEIGEAAIVGAGAVVVSTVPSHTKVVGIPARSLASQGV